jgi:putative transposase
LHRKYYAIYNKSLSANKLKIHIAKLKKLKKYKHWNKLNSQSIQDIVERIDRAYKLFFRNLKNKIKTSPPSFKKRSKYKSFTLKQCGYKLLENNVVLVGNRKYKYFKSREVEGDIKIVTIKRDSINDLYIYFICEIKDDVNNSIETRTGKIVGFDFGLKTYLKASDGNDIESPLFFKEGQVKIKKLNRSLSHKKRGSNHRKNARYKLAKQHIKIANQRKDFQFKLANKLCETYDTICLEDLNIKAMQMIWGRKISDLSHSSFVNILKHIAMKYKITIFQIPRFYASSKTCSECGHIIEELSLKLRSWVCPNCNTNHDRDLNAAINILRVGASTLGKDTVNPVSTG